MDAKVKELAQHLLHVGFDDLPDREQGVLRRIAHRSHVSRDVGEGQGLRFGERLSDRVAEFGGSWCFIIISGALLTA